MFLFYPDDGCLKMDVKYTVLLLSCLVVTGLNYKLCGGLSFFQFYSYYFKEPKSTGQLQLVSEEKRQNHSVLFNYFSSYNPSRPATFAFSDKNL